MSTTKIEWVSTKDKPGKVWNPTTGCTHVSEGCRNCYAEREFPLRAANPKTPIYHGRKFSDVACHPERLDIPLKTKKPTRWFVDSMSDLFHEQVPFEFIRQVYETMARCPHHEFLILSKRPERALSFYQRIRVLDSRYLQTCAAETFMGKPWPLPNVWMGVSPHNQETFDRYWQKLSQIPAAVLWASVEPMLGPVDISQALAGPRRIDWIVAGGESGRNARPSDPRWFEGLRDQCMEAGVPFFFKQWGKWKPWDFDIGWHPMDKDYESHHFPDPSPMHQDGETVYRIGKKKAGRILGSYEHNEFPEVKRC